MLRSAQHRASGVVGVLISQVHRTAIFLVIHHQTGRICMTVHHGLLSFGCIQLMYQVFKVLSALIEQDHLILG